MRMAGMHLTAFIALIALLTAPAINAGGGHDPVAVVQHLFAVADQNRDGRLSQDEYEKAGLQRFGVSFDESDTDANGETSLAEYLDLYHRLHPPVDDDGV